MIFGDTSFLKQSLTGEPKNSKKTPMPNPKRVKKQELGNMIGPRLATTIKYPDSQLR